MDGEPQRMGMRWYKVAYKPEVNAVVHVIWPLGMHPDHEAARSSPSVAGFSDLGFIL
jgi:hypothetical protein